MTDDPAVAPIDRRDTSTWPVLLTIAEAAHVLGIHPETLRIMLREGRVAGTHIGRRWYVRKTDILGETGAP